MKTLPAFKRSLSLIKKLPFIFGFLGMGLTLVGCQLDTRQSALDPKGPLAQSQYDLLLLITWVTLFIFIVVGGTLLIAVIKFRERPTDIGKPYPMQSHGNPIVEFSLILASLALLVIIAIPTVKVIYFMNELPEDPESQLGNWYSGDLPSDEKENVLEVNVTGYQWWWKFEYPQLDVTTGNEMVIPVNKVVKINLRSADVIHSFWLPKIAGKVDLIPGRRNWMWIRADEPGHYYGQCAEFCGEAHAYMLFRSDVLSEVAFVEWVKHQKKPSLDPSDSIALGGKELFLKKTCVQCHTIKGNPFAMGVRGPDLTHIASRKSIAAGILDNRNDAGEIDTHKQSENLFNWIKNSPQIKPGNLMHYDIGGLKDVDLSDDDVHKIVAYLQTLQ